MTTTLTPTARPSTDGTRPAPLPPLGPAWFPAAMGTGILATLLQTHADQIPGGHYASLVVLATAWVILSALVAGFGARIARSRAALTDSFREVAQAPMWGTVSMGILAVGAATATVVPAWWPGLAPLAWQVDLTLWVIGTAIGVVAALGFGVRLVGRDNGAPTTVWGLAVVGPMVSATTGASLVPHVPDAVQLWLMVGTVACFFLSLFVGSVVFAVAYNHHWRVAPVPLAASCSAWIPLGMVGQSTAAAQAMAHQAAVLAPGSADAIQQIANTYGYAMVLIGAPLIAWATLVTARGFARRMPFSPGWWALTFPIGTLALGAHLLGQGTGQTLFTDAGVFFTLVLVGTVTLCIVSSVRGIRSRGLAN